MSDNIHVRDLTAGLGEFEFRATPDGDGLTVSGYIARFAEPTVIEDWLGNYTEEIKRGAFTRTLAERGAGKIKMQFNHGSDAAFGALPVGVWTDLREDRKGLYGEGRIHDTWHTIPIRAAIQSGALDGMSFKFKVLQDTWRKGDPKAHTLDHRTLTEVALFEAGMVVHPAYEGTTLALRSRALDMLRREMGEPAAVLPDDERADTLHTQAAVTPVGDTDPVRAEAGPPVGITRREMSVLVDALIAREVIHDSDRGAA